MARAEPLAFAPHRYAPEYRTGFSRIRSSMADKLARAKLARAAMRFATRSRYALPPLILMTDDARLPDPLGAARALPRGSKVILRARDAAKRVELATKLRAIAKARGLKLLIAGDAELA